MSEAVHGASPRQTDERQRAEQEISRLSAAEYADPPEQCDIIMKGGITSGVVYPLTICKLAGRYRLRSIGGTSAGAIAAVMAAAAEHRRQRGGPTAGDGYRRLAALPRDIAARLGSLFQPVPAARPMKAVLDAAIDPEKNGFGRMRALVTAVVAHKPWWFVSGLLLAVAIALPGLLVVTGFPVDAGDWARIGIGLLLPAAAGAVLGIVLAAGGLALDAKRILPRSGFGITDGGTHADDEPGLTDWLAAEIDLVGGISDPDDCLTLGDLWGDDAVEAWSEAFENDRGRDVPRRDLRALRRVELEVITTNLTVRRPYRLPFETQQFLFDESEMRQLFPGRVVDKMTVRRSEERHPETGEQLWWFPGAGGSKTDNDADPVGAGLPGPEALPLIVMARMSLSFPGLIAAVPLYAVDYNGAQSVVRMMFSDGGVSSNFPMHFFDALLPTRPTFGVNLAPRHPDHPDTDVWRPRPTSGGTIPRAKPFETVSGFVSSLLDTMQNWSDNKQLTQRGYADRVVEIRLAENEGGMNLAMPESLVLSLAARGAAAGDELLTFDWEVHRVIRYRVAMARLTDALDHLRSAWEADAGALYPELITDFPSSGAASSYVAGSDWRSTDREATEALVAAIARWDALGWPALARPWPRPAPEIRMAPR